MARRPPQGPPGRRPVVPPAKGAAPAKAQGQLLGVIVAGVFAAVAIVVGGIALSGGSDTTTVAGDPTTVPSISASSEAATPSEAPTEAAPTEAAPTEAAPTEAAPTEAAPTEPAPAPTSAAPAPSPAAPAPTAAAPQPTPAAPQPTPAAPQATPPAAPAAPAGAGAAPSTSSIFQGLSIGVATEDVSTWQARMAERGWDLQVDGVYGPRSASVATAFQAEKGLAVDGIVGPETWNAAWTTPIT